jgi:tetratricopeptide (TPR) repeat protein
MADGLDMMDNRDVLPDKSSDVSTAFFSNAMDLLRQGHLVESEVVLRRLLSVSPGHVGALHHLAIMVFRRGAAVEAESLLARALALAPGDANLHNDHANALRAMGRFREAIADYGAAVALQPAFAEAWTNMGIALRQAGRLEEAEAAFGRAVMERPDLAAANHGLGNVLALSGRQEEAVACFRRALASDPTLVGAYNNLGSVLTELGRPDEALEVLADGLRRRPDYPEALVNLGNALVCLHRLDEGMVLYRRALALDAGFALAHHNLGQALLMAGEYAQGWREFEWRWAMWAARGRPPRGFGPIPPWRGEALDGRTILLYGEQGLGDVLNFIRFAEAAAARGGRVVAEVFQPLRRLAATAPGVTTVVGVGDDLPPFDCHAPLMSVPGLIGADASALAPRGAYLRPDPAAAAAWGARLAGLPGRKVGLVWAGGNRGDPQAMAADRRRSLTLAAFAPVLSVPGISFVSLQMGPSALQLADRPDRDRPFDPMGEVADFADTAAIVANLDLVIGVDTSVVHLAGAMGKPVWILCRAGGDWRWGVAGEATPWYPTARLFRQPGIGAWDPVVAAIARALAEGW